MTADHAAREVVTAELSRSVVVEAGAGSGKTTAIIDRVVALVLAGTPIESIVAVTFTEAAAGDLRTRLRAALESVVAADDDTEPARRALAQLDEAAIGTIHSWARRMIAEHPFTVGLPAHFDVLDEVQTSIDRARSWRTLLDALLTDPRLERTIAALDAARYRLWQLREAYEALTDNLDRLDTAGDDVTVDDPAPAPVTIRTDAVLEAINTALEHAPHCTDPDDKLLARLDDLARARHRLRSSGDDLARLEILCEDPWPSGANVGRGEHWPDKEAVASAVREVKERVLAVRSEALDAAVRNVVARLVVHVRDEAARRRREGVLQFPDLLVLARELLRSSQRARHRLHERWRVVIVDEFQDTDPLQIELATLVATDGEDATTVPWRELPVPEGRLVIVGDPKQSIYRFRRADLRVFRDVLEIHSRSHVAFTANFRSRPGILAWVDACIGTQLAEDAAADPFRQANHTLLGPNREAHGEDPPVMLLGDEHDGTLTEVREQEASEIAGLLDQVRSGRFWIEDRNGGLRRACLGDSAILLPTRVTLPYLVHALAVADIPMRIESETLVLATQAVRDLIVVLEALADPNDQIAVVAALRTPGIACRDDELALHALAGGDWSYLAPVSETSPTSVRRGLALLRELHEEAALGTVDGAVEHVIRSCRLLELGLAHRRPRDHWRRVLHVSDLARAFVESGGVSLREFVAWLRDRADAELRRVEVPVPEPDDDAVRVLTVHGAKGLEFPITILAGLNVEDRTPPSAVLWRNGNEPVLTGSRIRPGDYDELFDDERAAASAEALRLLYVAVTRARDHLVVSVHRTSSRCAAGRLAERSAEVPELWARWEPDDESQPAPVDEAESYLDRGRDAKRSVAPESFDLDAWQATHDAILARGAGSAAVAATTLATLDEPDQDAVAATPEWPSHRTGRAGTAVGRAVHATLQSIDLGSGAGLEPAARAQAHAEGIPELTDEVRALAASALAAPIVRSAVESGRFWREVPVGARVDGTVVEGFVDLLVETPDGLVVVDYKTDRVRDVEDIDERMHRYRVQGAAYALALESVLGRPVARCVFVFTRTTGAVERDIDDLDGARTEVRGRLSAPMHLLSTDRKVSS